MAADEFFLVDDREVALTSRHDVACDGGGALGHPVEYMTLGTKGEVVCQYCGRRYLAADHPQAGKVRREGTPYAPPAAA